jgi:hypothetical protein
MSDGVMSPNSRESIGAIDSITGGFFYVEGTSATGAINVNIAGSVGTTDSNITEIGGSPITLGQKTMANSLPITIASDQSALPVSQSGSWSVTTTSAAPTTIYNGRKAVTTAGVRVSLASSQAIKSVAIKALVGNTGFIYVGDSAVASSNGFQLSAGDTVSLDISNLATIFLDSSVNGEGVSYISS